MLPANRLCLRRVYSCWVLKIINIYKLYTWDNLKYINRGDKPYGYNNGYYYNQNPRERKIFVLKREIAKRYIQDKVILQHNKYFIMFYDYECAKTETYYHRCPQKSF